MKNYYLIILLLMTVGFNLKAQTTLNVPNDYSTVAAAISAATSGDIIELSEGVHETAATLTVTKSLTFQAVPDASSKPILRYTATNWLFHVNTAGVSLVFKDIILDGNDTGQRCLMTTAIDVDVEANNVDINGFTSIIFLTKAGSGTADGGTLIMNNCTVEAVSGAIIQRSNNMFTTINVSNCLFLGGANFYLSYQESVIDFNVNHCTFNNFTNKEFHGAGGSFNSLNIKDCIFSDNTSGTTQIFGAAYEFDNIATYNYTVSGFSPELTGVDPLYDGNGVATATEFTSFVTTDGFPLGYYIPEPSVITSVGLTAEGDASSIKEDETLQYTALVLDQYGQEMDGETVTWSSTSGSIVDGVFTPSGVATGAEITATSDSDDGVSSMLTLDVLAVSVLTSISVTPQDALIIVNSGEQQFAAQGLDQYDENFETSVTWSASGGDITTGGLFTGDTEGEFTVTATSGEVQGASAITVGGAPVLTTLEISGTAELTQGDVVTYTVEGFDQYGDPIEKGTITWSVDGGSIESSGEYTATTIGMFTITAESAEVSREFSVTVRSTDFGVYMIGNSLTLGLNSERLNWLLDDALYPNYYGSQGGADMKLSEHWQEKRFPSGGTCAEWKTSYPINSQDINGDFGNVPKALGNDEGDAYTWDALILQPHIDYMESDESVDGGDCDYESLGDRIAINNFLDYATGDNPNSHNALPSKQAYLYGTWPYLIGLHYKNPAVTQSWSDQSSYTTAGSFTDYTFYDFYHEEYDPAGGYFGDRRETVPNVDFLQQLIDVTRSDNPDISINLIPAGEVMAELDVLIRHGELPGIEDYMNRNAAYFHEARDNGGSSGQQLSPTWSADGFQFIQEMGVVNLYCDNIHMNDQTHSDLGQATRSHGTLGAYVASLTIKTVLTGNDPRGTTAYDVINDEGYEKFDVEEDEDLIAAIQEAVWSVVLRKSRTGVTSEEQVLSRIELNETYVEGFTNNDVVFTATGYDQNGVEITGLTFDWSAYGGSVEDGVFTSDDIGLAFVSASVGAVIGEAKVNVSASASDATLSSISIDDEPIQEFATGTLSYDVLLPFGTVDIPVVAAITTDESASVEVTQAGSVESSASILVTAQDGETTETYVVNFSLGEELSSDATLLDITIDDVSLEGFLPETTSYSYTLPFGRTSAPTLSGMSNDSNADMDVTQAGSVEGTATILVTAEDGETQLAYSVVFSVAEPATDASLSDLLVDGTTIPEFDQSTFSYTVTLSNTVADVPDVTAVLTDDNASLDIDEASSLPGSTNVTVTAEDGTTTAAYTVSFEYDSPLAVDPASDLKFFPNPASHSLKISGAKDGSKVTITNLSGKSIGKTLKNSAIDVSDLVAGVYILNVEGYNSAKFIISRSSK